ncbi:hypothetical protein BDF22DRAFT_671972 [Syncephalis plumigaleata]|nr:hypothetical protein BDF22DRAFT_671972 [Syncephalis plumigaleata]
MSQARDAQVVEYVVTSKVLVVTFLDFSKLFVNYKMQLHVPILMTGNLTMLCETLMKITLFNIIRFTKKHLDAAGPAHHNAKFLPWHRALLLEFEQALQRTSSGAGMMVPYWNWSADSQNPAGSIIFNRDWFGGDGRGDCVTDGCLTRSFNSNGAISSFVPPEDIERLVGLSDYNDFRVQLEDVPHAQVHIRIGADFAGMASPNE